MVPKSVFHGPYLGPVPLGNENKGRAAKPASSRRSDRGQLAPVLRQKVDSLEKKWSWQRL